MLVIDFTDQENGVKTGEGGSFLIGFITPKKGTLHIVLVIIRSQYDGFHLVK